MDVHIFTGHRGSGKTEIAVNFAIRLAFLSQQFDQKTPVGLLDVDVVNPYFAARDARTVLEAHGIKVAAPSLATTTADLPVLSGEISRMLHHNEIQTVVIDTGGDPAGAHILRTLHRYLRGKSLATYCVVNTKRPSTSDYEGIIAYIDRISAASQLPMTGLIHNTHLLAETSIEDILYGQRLLGQVSASTKLPIVLTTVMKPLAQNIQTIDTDVFTLEQYIKPPYVL